MNLQEMFDKIWDWTIVQNQPRSFDCNINRCLYRGPNGTKCFIGVLIPDELYSPELELSPLPLWSIQKPELKQVVDITNYDILDFLYALRRIHDTEYLFNRREIELRNLAKDEKLTVPIG